MSVNLLVIVVALLALGLAAAWLGHWLALVLLAAAVVAGWHRLYGRRIYKDL